MAQSDYARLAREVNTHVPGLLKAALGSARASDSADLAAASSRFSEELNFISPEVDRGAIAFAVARYAAEVISQLSAAAGADPHHVLDHFERTYFESLE